MRNAINYKVLLVMYGEDGEIEYGGSVGGAADSDGRPTHYVSSNMIKNHLSGILPSDWIKYGIDERDLDYYEVPSEDEAAEVSLENHFFGTTESGFHRRITIVS